MLSARTRVLAATPAAALMLGSLATVTPAAAATQATWSQQTPAHSPPGRSFSNMAKDPASGDVLFGGNDTTTIYNDTWRWANGDWTQLAPATSPAARTGAAMAYDATHHNVILFGGVNNQTPTVYSDTWSWNGTTWTHLTPVAHPSARYQPVMAYDALLGGLVLYGGTPDGNVNLTDTWLWDGSNWSPVTTATHPGSRAGTSLAPDPNGGVVLYGGITDSNNAEASDTWVLDSNGWTQATPALSPPAEYGGTTAALLDGRVLLFGGGLIGGSVMAPWVWDGTTWVPQNPATRPPDRQAPMLAVDLTSSSMLMWGGIGTAHPNDTWLFSSATAGTDMTPALTAPTIVFGKMPGATAGATLHTTVTPRNLTTSIACDSGLTTAYTDHTVLDVSLTGTAPIAESCYIDAAWSTTYYWRLTATNAAGTTTLTGSFTAPATDTTPPTIALRTPTALISRTLATTVSWTAADASGIASTSVRYFRTPATTTTAGTWAYPYAWRGLRGSSLTVKLAAGYRYCFSVRTFDMWSNASGWSSARCTSAPVDDRALVRSSGWVAGTGRGYINSTFVSTTRHGATLTLRRATTRDVGVIAYTGPTAGSIAIYVGTTRVGAVTLTARTRGLKMILVRSFTRRTGAVRIIVTSASGRLVRIDALPTTV